MGRDSWDQHWSDYAASAQANPAQRFRRLLIRKFLHAFSQPGQRRIVDLGSGQGDLARELRSEFPQAELLGVELSTIGIDVARQKTPSAVFRQQDLLRPVPATEPYRGWATCAVCAEVLEHVDDPVLFLRNAAAYMDCGCTLVVTVPGGPMSEFDRHIGHRKHYSTADLRGVLEAAGFSIQTTEAAGFPFFNLYRMTVILRGKALIADVSRNPSIFAKVAGTALMGLFRVLFAANSLGGKRGWQTVAVATWLPDGKHLAPVEPGARPELIQAEISGRLSSVRQSAESRLMSGPTI